MDFSWSEEQQQPGQAAVEFAGEHLNADSLAALAALRRRQTAILKKYALPLPE